jgi:hypothetical protein
MAIAKHLTGNEADGTCMGQSATDKISFYGATPVVQRSSSNQTTSNVVTSTSFGTLQVAQVQEILNILNGLGLSKGA